MKNAFMSMLILILSPLVNSEDPLAPAIYVFGDSLVDSGNNNVLSTLAKANYLPYGVDFSQGTTGRFTNGRTMADFIAEYLKLPFAPPYLIYRGLAATTGYNYASGSCGILPDTGAFIGKCLNLDDQLNLFEVTVKHDLPRHFQDPQEVADHLAKAIFVISAGGNDFLINSVALRRYSPQEMAQVVVDALKQRLQRLYELGARKVVMLEVGPIGCIPSLTKVLPHPGKCVEDINQRSILFNNLLGPMLSDLTATLIGSNFILGHGNWFAYDAILNPSKYGLTDSSEPCCITYNNGTLTCIPGTIPCKDKNQHFYWDGVHPTEVINCAAATRCIYADNVCLPLNIKALVQV